MMQFRLTKNFAKDCGIKNLQDFEIKSHPLDDWFIDYFHAPRKKVAMIVHGKTLFTFFISYEKAGGAKKIPEKFHQAFNDFFKSHGILHLKNDVDALFSEGFVFTKTSDRTILGHMNDFVRCSQPYPHETGPFDCINQAITIFLPLEEKWYQRGDEEIGHRQFIVADPDGYLLRFYEQTSIRHYKKTV